MNFFFATLDSYLNTAVVVYCIVSNTDLKRMSTTMGSCGVSSDLDGYRGALKREVFFHTFFCVLVRICNQTSSNQHLLVVGC